LLDAEGRGDVADTIGAQLRTTIQVFHAGVASRTASVVEGLALPVEATAAATLLVDFTHVEV
jgi:hypothetical protein